MRRLLPCLLLAALAACGRVSSGSMPAVTLPSLSSSSENLASCPTPKCLTVYVAPWCGYCRAATPMINALRDYLGARRVRTRIVVGLDRPEAVRVYARDFGPATLLDPDNRFALTGGVPHFFVSDDGGRLLNEVPGIPRTDDVAALAAFFGLP